MTTTVEQRRFTLDEYLDMEYHAQKRHYYYKGIVAPISIPLVDIYHLVNFAPDADVSGSSTDKPS